MSLVLDPIAEIAKFVPGLHVEPRQGSAEKLIEFLLEGEIDTAMVWDVRDIPAPLATGCCSRSATSKSAPTHPLANRSSIGIDDLRETVLLNAPDLTVAPKIQRSYFPEEPPQLGHCSGHDLHLQHMAAAGSGVILASEHMPRLPGSKDHPLEADPVSRKVRLLAVQWRRYSPALEAFVKVARLRDWSVEVPTRVCRNARFRRRNHDTHAGGQPLPADRSAAIRRLTDAKPDRQDTRSDSHRAVDDVQRRGLGVIQPPSHG